MTKWEKMHSEIARFTSNLGSERRNIKSKQHGAVTLARCKTVKDYFKQLNAQPIESLPYLSKYDIFRFLDEHTRKSAAISSKLTSLQTQLAELNAGMFSMFKSGQIKVLEQQIVELKNELSEYEDLQTIEKIRNKVSVLYQHSAKIKKLIEVLSKSKNLVEIRTKISQLKEAIAEDHRKINHKLEDLKSRYQQNMDEIIQAQNALDAERSRYEPEFSHLFDLPNPLDVLSFGCGNALHEMVMIPKGDFVMGALEDDGDASDDEKPRHKVTLTHDFLMGKYPVTQALWESVMGSNPSHFKGTNRPVEKVSWLDVIAFCNKLSQREGLEPVYSGLSGYQVGQLFDDEDWTGRSKKATVLSTKIRFDTIANGYRLPTEAEWEYAARANQSFKYSGSDNLDEVAWYDDNSGDETHPVGLKPNGFGLYDMSGNVCEWVWDVKGDYSSDSQTDPTGLDSGPNRVYRGGSWNKHARHTRVSRRDCTGPDDLDYDLGFRLVRTIQLKNSGLFSRESGSFSKLSNQKNYQGAPKGKDEQKNNKASKTTPSVSVFQMSIEEVFFVDSDVVLSGKILKGSVRVGATVYLRGENLRYTVKKINKFRSTLNKATAGDEVGLVLDTIVKKAKQRRHFETWREKILVS